MLINNAKSDDDFIPIAAIMYSNVEENLIFKFNLKHEGQKFVIDYDEYLKMADELVYSGKYCLKTINQETGEFDYIIPRVIDYDEKGRPKNVEMLPIVRFVKIGLEISDAKLATNYWTVLNKIRHKSPENIDYLKSVFGPKEIDKKEYFKDMLSFFKKTGLYTKE